MKTTVFFILLCAFFLGLRIYHIDNQKDGWDQERDFVWTLKHFEGEELQYSGPRFGHKIRIPSVVYHWILSVPLLFSKTMIAMRVWVVIFNFLALIIAFFVVRKLFDDLTALLTMALMTFSPFSIKYSVFLWNPNFMPLFAILILYLFWHCVQHERSKAIFLWLVVFYLAFSFHFLSLSYGLFFLLGWIAFRVRLNLKYFLGGVLFILFFSSIYLYFDKLHHFANLKADIFPPGKGGFGLESLKSIQWTLLFPSNEISSFLEKGFDKNLAFFIFPSVYFWFVILLFLPSVIIPLWAYVALFRQEISLLKNYSWKNYLALKRTETILILFLICVPLFLVVTGRAGVPRYALMNAPAMFIIVAWFLREKLKVKKWNKIIWTYLVLQFVNQTVLYIRLEDFSRINS